MKIDIDWVAQGFEGSTFHFIPWAINFKALSDPYFYTTLSLTFLFAGLYFLAKHFGTFNSFITYVRLSSDKRTKVILELRRKKFHLAGTAIPLLYYGSTSLNVLPRLLFVGIIVFLATIVVCIELSRFTSEAVNKWFISVFGSIMREKEYNKVSGTTYYFSGCAATLAIFPPPLACIAILYLVYGDLFAAMVGMIAGRHRIYQSKTLEGLLGCIGICTTIGTVCLLLFKVSPLYAVLVALAGAIVCGFTELWCNGTLFIVNDNFMIPINSSIIMWLLVWALGLKPHFATGCHV
ncbi:protein phosphatase 2A regularoty B subunit [Carpediemonas membranifera]|uniref:Protein phosphatase 2A regularoty B subunit n=1 Tax=Carpediemonas membranifera TaxID=201153 RepID=A0A8J6BWI6_9EUKA|nr:protein phosphatase 2A regularoty B subunit [Carpediemonas membranifera]|eukprot:KAG9392481.1 protein phosphatase 2A regularoty B subunit [Carpediemonas membranifera]